MRKVLGKKVSRTVNASNYSCMCGTGCTVSKKNTVQMNLIMTG